MEKSWKQILKKTWHFIWEDDSMLSWIVNILLAFILIKFIVYPGLGFILSTDFPIVAVVSGSMEHKVAPDASGTLKLCDKTYEEKESINFNTYWETCGSWYEAETVITKDDFQQFPFRNGFNEGDIMILKGKQPENINIGDVIVFKSNRPDPIIHRVVKIWEDNGYHYQTKGDHNERVIKTLRLDESDIHENQVLGNALFRIPYLGWVKIAFVKLITPFMN